MNAVAPHSVSAATAADSRYRRALGLGNPSTGFTVESVMAVTAYTNLDAPVPCGNVTGGARLTVVHAEH